uniref:F-box/LRR-repeat protein n=1 Tax=Quercus lobata TaxID=97700 RepID=A0A7N2MBH0_QUELO
MRKKNSSKLIIPPWGDFDPFLLSHILSFLPLHDQLFVTPYVSCAWLTATLDTLFHNSILDLVLIDELDDEIQRLRFTHLLRLAINRYHGWVSIYLPRKYMLSYFAMVYIAERTPMISSLIMPCDVALHAGLVHTSLLYWENLKVFKARLDSHEGLLLQQLADSCKNIVELGVHGEITEKEVSSIIEGFPRLKILDISESTLCHKALNLLLDGKLRSLRELDILHCSIVGDDGKDITLPTSQMLSMKFNREIQEKASQLKSVKFTHCLGIYCKALQGKVECYEDDDDHDRWLQNTILSLYGLFCDKQ